MHAVAGLTDVVALVLHVHAVSFARHRFGCVGQLRIRVAREQRHEAGKRVHSCPGRPPAQRQASRTVATFRTGARPTTCQTHGRQHPQDGLQDPSLHRRVLPQHDPERPPWCEQHPRCSSGKGDVAAGDGDSTRSNAHPVSTATIRRSMNAPPDRPGYRRRRSTARRGGQASHGGSCPTLRESV